MRESFGSERIIGFTKYLRSEGFVVGMNETVDAIKLISEHKEPDRYEAEHILRSVSCSSVADWHRFDILFQQYWFNKQRNRETLGHPKESATVHRTRFKTTTGLSGSSSDIFDDLRVNKDLDGPGAGRRSPVAGRQRTISKADFRFLNDSKAMLEAEQMAEDLAKILIKSGNRKRIISTKGQKLAIRQTIRSNLSFGGFPIIKRHFSIKRVKPHLVILHDVSHSMSWNNPLLFRFVRGLIRIFKDSEAFVFHTELFPVTSLYLERSLKVMRDKLEGKNHLWLGGTCIAESIQKFNQDYAKKILKKNSIIIIISDGFDTNSPELLAAELESIKQSSRSILWLNPMLGRTEYSVDNQTIKAASPYIKKFIAAHSIDSLKECIQYIDRY
ncbi:MAG: hypothetical protein ACI9ZT_000576 [Gammaproteobacteria bacterium]